MKQIILKLNLKYILAALSLQQKGVLLDALLNTDEDDELAPDVIAERVQHDDVVANLYKYIFLLQKDINAKQQRMRELGAKGGAARKKNKNTSDDLPLLDLWRGDVDVSDIKQFWETDRRTSIISLDQLNLQCEDDFTNWGEKIADISYEEMQSLKEDRLMLLECLDNIDPDLKKIVDLTYFQDMSQKDIAKTLGISQMQVSRKLKKALDKLYKMVRKRRSA